MISIRKITIGLVSITMLSAPAAYASGGTGGPTVAATASATVIQPVTISQTTGLSFGTFAASPTSAGTVDSSGNVTGGVNVVTAGNPAAFAVSGVSGNNYTIVGDPTVTLVDTANSGNTMSAALTYPSSPRTLTGGSDNFNVSGVLSVAASQPADTYSGTYNVSVHY